VLEGCRHAGSRHLLYASSSSVYGANTRTPFRVTDNVDHPLSLYAATKKANELMAHTYAHLFDLPATGLRFFTVYGPWGRPDMAVWLFTEAVLERRPVKLFNHGKMRRDFTYIDDVTESVVRLIGRPPRGDLEWSGQSPNPASSRAPWRIYNIGNNRPVELEHLLAVIEAATGRTAVRELLPIQPGDVTETYADIADLAAAVDFAPRTLIEDGVNRFVSWYRAYIGRQT
jgi:UDP-glucuronate 4-epimerase